MNRNVRRSTRNVSPKNYCEDILASGESRSRARRASESSDTVSESGDTRNVQKSVERPELLFNEAEDVEGHEIYTFQTPKKRKALANYITNRDQFKTPSTVRQKLKEVIQKNIKAQDASSGDDEDFSGDESDYSPGQSEGSSTSNEEEGNATADDDEDQPPAEPKTPQRNAKNKILLNLKAINTPKPTRGRKPKDQSDQCVIESENYFQTHSKGKGVTSNHTLDQVRSKQMPQDEMEAMLQKLTISGGHATEIAQLYKEAQSYLPKWLLLLNEGYNILLYGLGSKRNLINSLLQENITSHPLIIINGFFPALTIQDVLLAIGNEVLEMNVAISQLHEAVAALEAQIEELPDVHIFLVIHNIDGPNLRSSKAQEILSRIAKIKRVHLIASIDHINAPLLWDHSKLSSFNFTWFDVTTMEPYWAETKFETNVISNNSGNLVLSSMRSVFQSLTSNAKGIYFIVVNHQLANKANSNYQGISFKELYSSCRDAFLVSSDVGLRTQLTEFTDHKLVRIKRAADGTEYLTVPIQNNLLQQFVDENQS